MILRPLVLRGGFPAQPIPAWNAIFPTQRQAADAYLLVTQDDHAQLAGEIAAAMRRRWLPELTAEVVDAIRLHDRGWQPLDERLIAEARNGARPPSFLDMAVPEFLVAWAESIEPAAHASAIGGVIVSMHFSRLANHRLRTIADTPEDTARLRHFLSEEEKRQASHNCEQAQWFTDVLQLCDLISLYLCCGAQEPVELPAVRGRLELRRAGEMFTFQPPILAEPLKFALPATSWPVTPKGSILRIELG